MPDHATLSPSSRHRWSRCPGSIREEQKYPESTGPAAIDGTHTHTVLDHCIKADLLDPKTLIGIRMKDHEGEFVVDADRAARVKVAIDYVLQRYLTTGALFVGEQKVDPSWLMSRNDLGGTLDIQLQGDDWIEIVDYKDGINDAWDSAILQMEQYALGVLAKYKIPRPFEYPFKTVRLTVIQPKLAFKGIDAIRWKEVPLDYILDTVGQQITLEAAATDRPDAPLVPGDSQCKYCRAKGGCSALASNVMKEIGVMFQPAPAAAVPAVISPFDMAQQSANKDPSTMDDGQIRQIIEAAPLMRQLLEAVEAEALRRMQAGTEIPGLKLVHGRGSRAWALPEEQMAEKLLGMGIPKGALYITKMVSPAQAEKLTWEKRDGTRVQLSKRQLDRMEKEYIVKMAGKITVAPASDERPAITTNAAPLFSAVPAAPAAPSLPSWLS